MAKTDKIYQYKKDYESDLEAHDKYTTDWDSLEAMLISKTYDSISKQTKNGITDSDAATMLIERSARVVGQLPEGITEAAGKKDRGKAALMDIIRSSYIYPNANAQRPFLEKLRMWELYSGVYGVSLMYYDWDVAPNGYIGPNCWLWNPRNFVPQKGKYSIEDMEYAHAISWITKAEISNLLKQIKKDETFAKESGWNKSTLTEIYDAIDNFSKDQDVNRTTYNERAKQDAIKGRVQIVTRFETGKDGKWVVFAPDMGALELRNIPNPHKNGCIPFIAKQSIQLMDSFYGLSDLQRAKPIQFAKDGLINFYFQGLKMNLYPPTVVNSQGILKHTVSNEPGAIWEEIIPNSARRLETSTAGLSTYQAVMGQMSGAIQNVYGTTTTQANSESAMSSQFGKSQRYSEPVLTPDGWTTMGELNIGDYVIDDKGKPAEILEIHEQGVIDSYDVRFSDGTVVNASADHVWTVTSNTSRKPKIDITTVEMLQNGLRSSVNYRYHVQLVEPIEFTDKEVSIDPYLMGLLLGDGGFTESENRISFTNSKERLQDTVVELLPLDSVMYRKNCRSNEFRIKGSIVDNLKEYNLKGLLSKEKFIPKEYLFNSADKRQRLLQGLLDTDGYKIKNGGWEYTTVSKQLAEDFLELSRGLGNYTRVTVGESVSVLNGERRKHGLKYRIYINVKSNKNIIDITKSEPEDSRCLYVDTPNHLYVTTGYTLTHNTPQALKMQSERESSRDNQNRSMLQSSIEQLMDRFYELIVNVGTEPFDVTLFSEDIKNIIAQGYKDVGEMIQWDETGNSGKIVIKPEALKGVSYRFNMKSDSTIKITKKEQKEDLLEFISVLAKHQNELQEIFKTTGKMVDWAKIIDQYAALADLPGIEEVFVQGEKPEENKPDPIMELLKAMNIQYTDLPEDIKQQVMQSFGVQTGELSPREKDIQVKETDAETRRIQALGQSTPPPEDNLDPDIGAAIDQIQNML